VTSLESSGLNAGYVGQLLEQYLENPEAVDPAWRAVFEAGDGELFAALPGLERLVRARALDSGNGSAAAGAAPVTVAESDAATRGAVEAPMPASAPPLPAVEDDELLAAVAAAMSLVKAYRMHGHLNAHLDPLGSEPMGDPALDESRLVPALTPELQARIPARLLRLYVPGETLEDALPRLRDVYTGTIAYEIEHISDHAERVWLRQAIESGRFRTELPADERRELLRRLAQVEAFETYLRRAFIGQKQFSIEGLDVLVPMLDEAVELAAQNGAHEVFIGIAHRGRLNVLTHVVGRSYASILREFEGERSIDALIADPEGGTGDVKYHLSASESRVTPAGEIQVSVASNPSHLEAVDPVVEGLTRAEQTDRSFGAGIHDPTVALPILTAYALSKHAERPLKRLYGKRDQLLADLKSAHAEKLSSEAAHERR
jgi:2-oxoglutarate dehydrogenase E1 component